MGMPIGIYILLKNRGKLDLLKYLKINALKGI